MTLAPVNDPIVITQYQVLLDDIEEAKKTAVSCFEYETKEGDKAARSYIFQLRKLRARVESARKDAKGYALAYGKRVDEQAKELSSQVDALIQPHQEQLEAIARREAERVQAHQKVLDEVNRLGVVPFGSGSSWIYAQMDVLDDIRAKGLDDLEEFAGPVAEAILLSLGQLKQALQQALQAEEQARELARLKAEQEEREAKEREERIKREAQEKADAEAAAAAADAIAAAERRAAEAEAKAREAEAKAAQAELAKASPVQPVIAEAGPALAEQEHGTFVLDLPPIPQQEHDTLVCGPSEAAKERLCVQLLQAMRAMHRVEVVNAIVDGHLHPALQINWGAVE
jgi:hypothetical protein